MKPRWPDKLKPLLPAQAVRCFQQVYRYNGKPHYRDGWDAQVARIRERLRPDVLQVAEAIGLKRIKALAAGPGIWREFEELYYEMFCKPIRRKRGRRGAERYEE